MNNKLYPLLYPFSGHKIFILAAAALILLSAAFSVHADHKIPQRVISLSPIITETIFLVGAGDKLIANTSYCTVPEEAQYKEKIGSVIQMNVEKIIRLKPDLVIASQLSREKQLKQLEKLSIHVVRAQNPRTFDQMCEMTLEMGRTLGNVEQAQKIVAQSQKKAEAILKETQGLEKPAVFLQIGIKPLHSGNKDMFLNEYIRYGGGINIAEHEGTGVYSREKVLEVDPDIILISTMGSSKKAGNLERQKWLEFKNMRAVKSNRVYVLDPEMVCSPTPVSFVKGLKHIVPLLHPDLINSVALQSGEGN